MAKKTTDSIWNWTKSGKSSVSHRGKTVEMPIPAWLQGDLENDPDGFLEQIVGKIGARTVLAKFLQQAIIDLRSAVRPNDKPEDPEEIYEEDVANESESWVMAEVKVPREKDDPITLLEKLKKKGYTKEQILEMLG